MYAASAVAFVVSAARGGGGLPDEVLGEGVVAAVERELEDLAVGGRLDRAERLGAPAARGATSPWLGQERRRDAAVGEPGGEGLGDPRLRVGRRGRPAKARWVVRPVITTAWVKPSRTSLGFHVGGMRGPGACERSRRSRTFAVPDAAQRVGDLRGEVGQARVAGDGVGVTGPGREEGVARGDEDEVGRPGHRDDAGRHPGAEVEAVGDGQRRHELRRGRRDAGTVGVEGVAAPPP